MPVTWGFTGPEGAGKTTAMTYVDLRFMKRTGGGILTFPGFDIYKGDFKGKGTGTLLSHPITMAEMVTAPFSIFYNKIVSISEIDNFCDSQRSTTIFNLLMGYIAKQRRKTGMGFTYDLQEWGDLFFRLRKKTHLLSLCWDLYWSPWGKDKGLKRGELMRLATFDCLGFYTGRPWKQLKTKLLKTDKLRPYFNSYQPVSIFEGMKKFEVQKQIYKLYPDGVPDTEQFNAPNDMTENDEEMHRQMDQKIMDDLADEGVSPKTMGTIIKRFARGD